MAKTRKNSDYQKTTVDKRRERAALRNYQTQKSVRGIIITLSFCLFGSIIFCLATDHINMVFFLAMVRIFFIWGGIPFIAGFIFKAWKANPNSKIFSRSLMVYYFGIGAASLFNDYVHDFGFSTSLLVVCTLWSFIYANTD